MPGQLFKAFSQQQWSNRTISYTQVIFGELCDVAALQAQRGERGDLTQDGESLFACSEGVAVCQIQVLQAQLLEACQTAQSEAFRQHSESTFRQYESY